MQKYLNTGIKNVIQDFPEVAKILDEFGIGCAPCSVGDCLLKDVVSIHNLGPVQERALMAGISRVIYPDRAVELPPLEPKALPASKGFKYSPPLKKLVDEHTLIKRCIARVPEILENLDLESRESRDLVYQTVDFIRGYADRYHHAKEEDILVRCFAPELDIIRAMHQDHDTGRGHIRMVLEGVERRDTAAVREHLSAWSVLLTQHIKKEDEILYPWMDRQLSTKQVGELFGQFAVVDADFGEQPDIYRRFVESLEARFASNPEAVAAGN